MINKSACLLLDPFQQYLGMSVIFGLSICTACAKKSSVGNENVLLEFFFFGGGGRSSNGVGLQEITERMKISFYLHVGKYPYLWDVSQSLD